MTAAVYPPLQENMTISDHRHASARWARPRSPPGHCGASGWDDRTRERRA
jgi:hypothetical protein